MRTFIVRYKIIKIIKFNIIILAVFFIIYNSFKKNLKVAVATMVKMENHYLEEWVKYYYRLGFKKIFIYDNNDINGEKLEDVIKKYISFNFVEIINYRGKTWKGINLQSSAYLDCYMNRTKDYDYLDLFDADEFLYLGKYHKIYNYLTQPKFNNFDCIKFPWLVFDDNDLINVNKNDFSLLKRFTRKSYYSKTCKSIFKTGFKQINSTNFLNAHGPIGLKTCDPDGISCYNGKGKNLPHFVMNKDIKKTNEYIRHFKLKTLQEFIDRKLKRLYADQSQDKAKQYLTLSLFFSYNKKTKEKLDYINFNFSSYIFVFTFFWNKLYFLFK